MSHRRTNKHMFALGGPPPERLVVKGRPYELVRVFKHDFFAATTLFESVDEAEPRRLVVKFGRCQKLLGLPTAWMGRLLARREERFHERMAGVPGVQKWVAAIGDRDFALEYVEGKTLDHLTKPIPGAVFDGLRRTLDEIHARGAAYVDLNKRSNIVVPDDGEAVLIDFQIAFCERSDVNPLRRWFLRRLVRYLQHADLYHLYKHKRSYARADLTAEEAALAQRRGVLIGLHRWLTVPYRRVRRWLLRRLYRAGRLVSPTAHLEDHYQPEKATWRR